MSCSAVRLFAESCSAPAAGYLVWLSLLVLWFQSVRQWQSGVRIFNLAQHLKELSWLSAKRKRKS
jgi:hypothetical protein